MNQKFDNQSLPGGDLDIQYKKGPKTPVVTGRISVPFDPKMPKRKLGKEPAAPQPKRR